jgi:type II pantothenate kinase
VIHIFQKFTLSVENNETLSQLNSNTIGIDLGQTLTKITYYDDEQLVLLLHPTVIPYEFLFQFLEQNDFSEKKINLTGGKGYDFYKMIEKKYVTSIFGEFEANVRGIEFLYQFKQKKVLPHCLIITIGTGTSMILRREKFEHIGGSALGGGFFMALIQLLYNMDNFDEAIKLASKGNRYKVDLKVADIYSPEDNRINPMFRQFTAASFGKISSIIHFGDYQKADLLNSLICMIGENVGTIAIEKAKSHKTQNLVFCGGFMVNNQTIQKLLSLICTFNQMKTIFLDQSIFSGALGMLLM